jgi:hypothetical protein
MASAKVDSITVLTLQTLLSEQQDDTLVQKAFYRKNYSQAKGIVAQVQPVAQAVLALTDACSFAVAGSEDIEGVSVS